MQRCIYWSDYAFPLQVKSDETPESPFVPDGGAVPVPIASVDVRKELMCTCDSLVSVISLPEQAANE